MGKFLYLWGNLGFINGKRRIIPEKIALGPFSQLMVQLNEVRHNKRKSSGRETKSKWK